MGCENVNIKRSHGLSPDFRGNYLFNTTVPGIEEADVMLIVGSNPRMESPVLNARIRKSVINYGLKVGVVGGGDDFTYEVDHLGNSPNTLK